MSSGTVLEGLNSRPNLAQASTPLGPPVKIQQAIHRCRAYSYLRRPHQKPRPAVSSVNLGTAQQGAPHSLRIRLDVAWVGPQVGGGRVSGNPLGRATSVIQFDGVMAMAALRVVHWEGRGFNREQWIPPALLYRASLASAPTPTMSSCKSLVPLCIAKLALVLRASRSVTMKICLQMQPL